MNFTAVMLQFTLPVTYARVMMAEYATGNTAASSVL